MLGFRLAKSLKPGYDMMFSRLQGTYNRNWFGEEQDADLTNQFGAEHYELAANGFPTAYHGVSFAPVNFLAKEKSMELAKLVERSQLSPMLVGTLVVTVPIAEPAVPAGIYSLLFRHAGVTGVDDIRLAGAFGSHIDPVYALVLGLVPDCPVEHVRSVGNAAGGGAVRALLSVAARREMEAAVRGVEKIETATEPTFQAEFVAAMAFPHATAPSPHLSTVVTLPERTASTSEGGRPGRRRRSRGTDDAAPAAAGEPS